MLFRSGTSAPMIKKIFLLEGLFISLSGAMAGLILGALICFLQQTFGIIKLENAEAFIVNAYPVSMQAMDFVIVFITVFVIGFAAAWFTSSQLVKKAAHAPAARTKHCDRRRQRPARLRPVGLPRDRGAVRRRLRRAGTRRQRHARNTARVLDAEPRTT